jgi:NAD(P)-dependent dehydrogenase (short-subunit alcohol dehydrogenase family)
VIAVHLTGTYNCTKAAWQHLLDSGSGRVVNTTSAAGLYGNFGQANYSAAKMGIVGFTRTTALEGAKYGLCANVIAPIAKSRMTEDIMPPELLEKLEPEWVSPLVGHLTSPQCTDTGQIFALGGGYYCKVATVETAGKTFGEVPSVEDIAGSWAQITDMTDAAPISNAAEAAAKVVGAVMNT